MMKLGENLSLYEATIKLIPRIDMDALISALAQTQNIAILVLAVCVIAEAKFILIIRAEARQDRMEERKEALAIQEKTNDLLDKLRESIDQMRLTIASKN